MQLFSPIGPPPFEFLLEMGRALAVNPMVVSSPNALGAWPVGVVEEDWVLKAWEDWPTVWGAARGGARGRGGGGIPFISSEW